MLLFASFFILKESFERMYTLICKIYPLFFIRMWWKWKRPCVTKKEIRFAFLFISRMSEEEERIPGRNERLAWIKIKTINGFFILQHQQSLARERVSLKVHETGRDVCLWFFFCWDTKNFNRQDTERIGRISYCRKIKSWKYILTLSICFFKVFQSYHT